MGVGLGTCVFRLNEKVSHALMQTSDTLGVGGWGAWGGSSFYISSEK